MKAFYLAMLLLIFGLHVKGQEKAITQQEKKIISLIANLPEMVTYNKSMIKKLGRPLVFEIDEEPTRDNPDYRVSVAQDHGDRLYHSHYFFVNGKTYAISYYDVIADKRIPLSYWRKHDH